MAYVSLNYANNAKAPVGKWTCSPTSSLDPFTQVPTGADTTGLRLCGQCVSYVKKVCPDLPQTSKWEKGAAVKDNEEIVEGTVIATFDEDGNYFGHAAIYVSQSLTGILVYDQYITPPSPKAVGPRTLKWNGQGNANNGNNFYVVE
jgi:hypothetical protein